MGCSSTSGRSSGFGSNGDLEKADAIARWRRMGGTGGWERAEAERESKVEE